jgi:hypothetical protein
MQLKEQHGGAAVPAWGGVQRVQPFSNLSSSGGFSGTVGQVIAG